MPMRESDKHFLWSLYYAVGIILIWKGVWEGIGSLPLLELPFVSLFVGLVMLTFSGLLMREFDPLGGLEKGVQNMLHGIHHHPQKEEFTISYFDNKKNKEVKIEAHKLKLIEKCGEIEFRLVEGSDEFVQLESLLAAFVLAGMKKA